MKTRVTKRRCTRVYQLMSDNKSSCTDIFSVRVSTCTYNCTSVPIKDNSITLSLSDDFDNLHQLPFQLTAP